MLPDAAGCTHGSLPTTVKGKAPEQGCVYLVGAGPGDPELLTLRAVRLLQKADVIVYDQLVSPGIFDLVPSTVERIDAGKRRNEHTLRQEQINALLVQLGQAGKQVVRLKGVIRLFLAEVVKNCRLWLRMAWRLRWCRG